MKIVFWITLLANVIFFAAMQWGDMLIDAPQTITLPALHEEKIRLLASQPDMPDASLSGSLPPDTAPSAAATLATSTDKSVNTLCLEWGDFSGADLARATAVLSAWQLGDKLSQRQIEHNIGYWVYMPPLKDKAAINQKLAQLKARGVNEYFVVQDPGPWLNAISLGVFKTREAAQNFLDVLRTKDVRTAQVGERASKLKATIFVLQGVDKLLNAKLLGLQQDFPGSVLSHVSCVGGKEDH